MAKKRKNNTSKLNPTILLIGVITILVLGALGVQVPNQIQEFFGLGTTTVSQAPEPPQKGNSKEPEELGTASFSAEELKNSQKGWITYHELDSEGRATGADALLKPAMVNTGTTADQNLRPPGFVSGKEPYGHSRGHLIGRQLGGTGDDMRNLTTLYQTPVNAPYMTKYENQIRSALDKGETVRYRVTPLYEGSEPLCKSIELEAKGLNKNTEIDFLVRIINER